MSLGRFICDEPGLVDAFRDLRSEKEVFAMRACISTKQHAAVPEELALNLQRAYAVTDRQSVNELLDRCLFLVDRLPLSTSEYAAFRNRLRNAQRYSWLREWGAARYELRLLQRSLAAAE